MKINKKKFVLTSIALGLSIFCASLPTQANIPTSVLENTSTPSLAPVLEQVLPAVVTISVEGTAGNSPSNNLLPELPPEFQFFFGDQFKNRSPRQFKGLGSGVIINADKGYVLTNNHVVDGADKITVTLSDGREYKAKLLGNDSMSDVALIQLENAKDLTQIKMADSDKAKVGDFVIAVGNPFGLGQTVTSGIISALGRAADDDTNSYQNYIQTDAAVNRGNSGGPLLNLKGELVGINTAIIAPSGGNVGIAFAIPSNMANSLAQQIIEFGQVKRGVLGIKGGELNADLAKAFDVKAQKGAFVSEVLPDSAAAKAGLKAGDIITGLNGQNINSFSELRAKIATTGAGKEMEITYLRDGKSNTVKVKLQADSESLASGNSVISNLDGADLKNYHEKDQKGVVIAEVKPNSKADQLGLKKGDIIIGINRHQINNIGELRKILDGKPAAIALNIIRGNNNFYLFIR